MNNQINRFSRTINLSNKSNAQNEISIFLEKYNTQYFENGAYLFLPEEVSKSLYFIMEGKVKLGFYLDSGRTVIKSILGVEDVFGESALIGIEQHKYFAQARGIAKICIIPIAEVKRILNENNNLTFFLLRKIGQRLSERENRLESFVFKNSRTRVIEFLLELGRKGRRVGYEQLVNNIMTHQEIADLTSTSRQTVTTTINELRSQNILTFNRRRMLIRDMDNLAAAI